MEMEEGEKPSESLPEAGNDSDQAGEDQQPNQPE